MSRGRLKLVSRRYSLPPRLEPATVAGRVPPHDLDAEAVVLSAILLSRDALDQVLETLKPDHFYSDANGRIYMAAQELAATGRPVDISTVASWLRNREWIQHIGGPSYLTQIADATPAVGHVAAHASVVYEKWRVRQLIAQCQRIAAEGYGDVGDVQEFIDGAEQAVFEIAKGGQGRKAGAHVSQALKVAFAEITAASERGDCITGIPTGYEKIDAKTAGLHIGDVMIVAGRPGMGKSALVANIAVNVASPRAITVRGSEQQQPGHGVCIFSIEMPEKQCAIRMACSEARVDLGRVRQNFLQPDDWRRLTEASSYISSLPIWIDDTSSLGLLDLRGKIRRYQSEYNRPAKVALNADGSVASVIEPERRVGLVIIDYLQLMRGREGVDSREQEIAEISKGLKILAKELGVAVIALSSLNRGVESRSAKDKRPGLADLRESGAIESDADTIVFIYRDEYYFPETTNARGIAELIIAKQRNGPTGKVLVRFSASCTRFDNLAAGDYPEMDEDA